MNIAIVLILFVIVLPLGLKLRQIKERNFAEELRQAVEARGGSVLSVQKRWFGNGPWWVRGKGQIVMKMIYRDAAGNLQQLWGRTGVFGNDLNWEYSDGEFDE
ncbi:MAG TPA: hypothetical protein VNT75_21285 [Symbiobacteriaceae bacterium]|nr:hypothetical protein [Symbiobacteriaceae bacterium]